jgi:hypothetical protein
MNPESAEPNPPVRKQGWRLACASIELLAGRIMAALASIA